MSGMFAIAAWLWVSLFAFAQAPPDEQFEVISIRPVPANAPQVLRSQDFTPVLPGGQYVNSSTNLLFLIAFAYDLKHPSRQLTGLPNWARNQNYSVAAKAGDGYAAASPGENKERVRRMMRHLLATRFQLRLHSEIRQERVYHLKAGKDGLKVAEVAAPVPPAKEGYVNAAMSDESGRIIGNKSTMAGMATMLAIFLRQPVIDETGLRGFYDFDVRWEAPPGAPSSNGLGAEGMSQLISVLKDKFGLQLSSAPGPVEYWIVDRLEQPSEN